MAEHTEDRPVRPRIPRQRVASSLLAVLAGTAIASGVIPSAGAATVPSAATLQAEVNKLTSTARAKAGCAPLVLDARLTLAAQRHATDMSVKKYFSHTSANGTTWIARIKAAGYSKPGGENIARGYSSAASVMTAWMNSPGHRANIVNCTFKAVGVGWAAAGNYWVQDFGY